MGLKGFISYVEQEGLEKSEDTPFLVRFQSFSGTNGSIYHRSGKIISSDEYISLHTVPLLIEKADDFPKGLSLAIERRRTNGANAYVLIYGDSIDLGFGIGSGIEHDLNDKSDFADLTRKIYHSASVSFLGVQNGILEEITKS